MNQAGWSQGRKWFKLHDQRPQDFGALEIKPDQAAKWNKEGFGIFWTVNEFRGSRRKENLTRILAWAVDLDGGDKPRQLERIRAGLMPSMLVETKSGYHAYFTARTASVENFTAIMADRLVPFYGADSKARDLCRILRVPGFKHLKDPSNPFEIRVVWESDCTYEDVDMLFFYPDCRRAERAEFTEIMREAAPRESVTVHAPGSVDVWQQVFNLDCLEALQRVSGHAAVGGESYTFKRNTSGTHNILVDGKSTSCWVDSSGRIGSLDGGGPTIAQWINWFHQDWKRTVGYLKELFPELSWKK